MKNRLLVIILSLVLSLPITVWAVDEIVNVDSTVPVVNTLDEDVLESSDYKQPISKRAIAKKFLAAMGGVAISSFAIFFLLSAYNRIRERFKNPVKTLNGEVSLESPDDYLSAVKSFLDKTKWN